ncbi:ABC transporter permease subunit [Cellulosimicrobium marinum]|uniref:ABC transporter permease subunit n=1 Tax=Cellulosimicrobium marinum TaxID=1638992 RepID=UPI001E5D115C|nr:ABC transporter permease subunit [Cellulosimicrobium marinum]MCB7137089.1 ABC transporter permease [Cellulosimicrobium marinum]
MSTTTLAPGATGPTATRTSPYRLTFGHVLRSEWIKFRSLRSTWWTLGITVVVMVGFALMFAGIIRSMDSAGMSAEEAGMGTADGVGIMVITIGYSFAQLAVAVLGALTMTGEYSTGMIRSTLSAVPRRLPALAAKMVIMGVVTAITTALAVGISYLVTYPILSGEGMTVDFGSSEDQRALVGVVLYLTTVALFSVAVGVLLRSSAGAIFTLVAVFFVLSMVLTLVQGFSGADWVQTVLNLLPASAGEQVVLGGGMSSPDAIDPWPGYAVLAGWTAALTVAAALVLKRRDA